MMLAKDLRGAVLQATFEGKLTKRLSSNNGINLLNEIKKLKNDLIKSKVLKKTRELPKIDPDLVPFDCPDNWIACYIDDVAFVTKLAGFEYSEYISPNLCSVGIPLFKGKNVQDGRLVFNFENYIPEELSDNLFRSQINKKCLLTPYVGTIGNVALFDGTFKAHLGSNVGKIELLTDDKKEFVLNEYLLWYLRSGFGYSELTKYKKATAQESISIDAIRNVIIPLPPIEEQQRIVEKVEELMAKIDEYEKLEKQLDKLNKDFPGDMKDAVLQAALQGNLTEQNISDSAMNIFKSKDTKFNEDDSYFDIPENWCWSYLKDVAELLGGFAFKSTEYTTDGTRVIRISDFNEDGFVDKNIVKYKYNESLSKYLIKDKDILMCMTGGTVGKNYYIKKTNEKLLLNQRVADIRSILLNPDYLNFVIKSPFIQKNINDNKNSTNDNISMDLIKKFAIPIPPLEEQQRIVDLLDKVLPLCDDLNKLVA